MIDEDAINIFDPDIILLFEILDTNKDLIKENKLDMLDKNLNYRIAWAYLRPIGLAKNHIGISKLQLFRYSFNDSKTVFFELSQDVPHVYYDFIWPNKVDLF